MWMMCVSRYFRGFLVRVRGRVSIIILYVVVIYIVNVIYIVVVSIFIVVIFIAAVVVICMIIIALSCYSHHGYNHFWNLIFFGTCSIVFKKKMFLLLVTL